MERRRNSCSYRGGECQRSGLVKQKRKVKDGIGLYPPPKQKIRTEQKKTHSFWLAAVQLLAVWLLAVSWWRNLTGVFPISADYPRLYAALFLFTAAMVLIWNMPVRAIVKWVFFLFLCDLAGLWIWNHPDAVVNVLNLSANAYLSVRRPDAAPFPLREVSDGQVILMFALFLLPLIFIWSLVLHLRKGKFFALVVILAPSVFILAERLVPAEGSWWMLLFSGAVYCIVCGCEEGRGALLEGGAAVCIFAVLICVSAFGSRPLEQYKQPEDGFYAQTRAVIKVEGVQAVQKRIEEIKADLQEKKEPEKSGAKDAADEMRQEEGTQGEQESPPEGEPPAQVETEIPEDAADTPLFFTDDGNENGENAGNTARADQGSVGTANGGAAAFPDLSALSRFQPDSGVRLTLTLDVKPETTLYYPVSYGILYADSRWSTHSEKDDLLVEICRQYPDGLDRLKAFCEENPASTFTEASDIIEREFEENTVYDYEPGATPPGKDFAEYFLFDNQRGFCVHFATTAVLMYRMYGYPARYVQGYAVPASAFQRQGDGRYQAEVTGEMGHAWCEVYEGDEWILKEHTLPYYGTRPKRGRPAVSSKERSWVPSAAGWGLLFLETGIKCAVCFGAVLLVIFFQAALRRQYKYRSFRKEHGGAGIQRIYDSIYDTAVFQGMEKTDILSEDGFLALRSSVPDKSPELSDSMEWLYQTVLETMFYRQEVTKQDIRRAWQIYRQVTRNAKKEMGAGRKFIYSYIKVL